MLNQILTLMFTPKLDNSKLFYSSDDLSIAVADLLKARGLLVTDNGLYGALSHFQKQGWRPGQIEQKIFDLGVFDLSNDPEFECARVHVMAYYPIANPDIAVWDYILECE